MKWLFLLWVLIILTTHSKADPIVVNNTRRAGYVAIPDIRLGLVPPPGFIFLPADDAFTHGGLPVGSAQYVVRASKINLDYNLVKDSITKNVPAGGIQDYLINHYTGVMTRRSVVVGAIKINLYTLAFGNGYYTYIISGYCPVADAATSGLLGRAILSAYVDTLGSPLPAPVQTKRGMRMALQERSLRAVTPALGFNLDVSGTAFKPGSVIGPLLAYYTQDGVYPPLMADKSFLRIYSMTASVAKGGRADFSQAVLNNYSEFSGPADIQVQSSGASTDGLSGYEVTCRARDVAGREVQVYQQSLFDGDTVYLLAGVYYPSAGSHLLPVFKTIFSSFKRSH